MSFPTWLNDYVGLPYVLGGRDRRGVDCYGLLSMVFDLERGIHLPDWAEPTESLRGKADAIEEAIHTGTWTEQESPSDFCIVLCRRKVAAHHIGLYHSGYILHAEKGLGAVLEPLAKFKQRYPGLEYGTWEP